MGDNKYKYLFFLLVFILLFSFSANAEEWRHPNCPEDFDGYKEEYGIPRWEFEGLFSVCYMPKEVYEFRKAREEDRIARTHYANESEEWRIRTEKTEAKLAELRKNRSLKPKPKNVVRKLPPTYKPSSGKWISAEEFKTLMAQNKDKIWWLNSSWKEQPISAKKTSIFYKIQNFKNKIAKKIKSKIYKFLFEK